MGSVKTFSGQSFFVVNPVGLAQLLVGPSGPVFRHMIEDGEKVKRAAIQLAPVGKADPLGRPRRDGAAPGNLRNHIVKRVVTGAKGVTVLVGVEHVPYAFWVHEGAQPHVIEGNPLLVFFWPKTGGVVAFPRVNHPGNKPNRFLIRALRVIRG